MRLFKFVKVDFIRCKNYWFFLLFPLLALMLMLKDADSNALFGCMYCLFGGIILSSTPFSLCSQANSGFLKMLPAQEGDEIRGHFLFSFCVLMIFLTFGLITIQAAHIYHPAFSILQGNQIILIFSVSLLFTAIQNLVLCVFRTNSVQAMQLLRMVPAFLFFFGSTLLADSFPELFRSFVGWFQLRNVCILLLLSILLYCIVAQISAMFASSRDY